MKRVYTGLFVFIFALLLASGVKAQQSDHKIASDFNQEYADIKNGFLSAQSVSTVDSLNNEITLLEQTYVEHSDILDIALYPETFDAAIEDLIKEGQSAENRLLIIESQGERLAQLGNEVNRYKRELSLLNDRTDSLEKAIAQSQSSEERLSRLVSEYRRNLQTRDELIVNVIDSLMITYSGMSDSKIAEITKGVESGRIEGDQNPLNLISVMLEENIEYATTNNAALNVEDHLRMYAVQNHFSDIWDRIGNRLINTYGDSKKAEWRASIDSKIKDWRMVTSKKMWESMDSYLEYSNVELDAFDNNYSFFVALDNFIKEAQKKSEGKILSNESYQDYKKFQEFWSGKIKNEWSNLVQESEVLTIAQISSIDEQLSGWESEARPFSPLVLFLIIVTILAIAGFSFAMLRTKNG